MKRQSVYLKEGATYESSQEFKFFSINKFEEMEDMTRLSPERFLQVFAPNRLKVLKNALNKTKFKFKGKFICDLSMPPYIGGYYYDLGNTIAINPYLLLGGSEKSIAHVIFHEGLHAGVYTNGVAVDDESVVETMTKKKIHDIYSGDDFRSGYDGMVNEAASFFGDLSFEEMQDKIEGSDEQTFDNFLELMVVSPALGSSSIDALKWQSIQSSLVEKWEMIKRLFPRMVNQIARNGAGVHAEARMNAHAFKLEGLLKKCAERIFTDNQELLVDIIKEILDENENAEIEEIKKEFYKEGYGYILDQENGYVEKLILEEKLKREEEKLRMMN